jgi:plastocyanin
MRQKARLLVLWGGVVAGVVLLGLAPGVAAAEERIIYMALIEPKGGVTVDKEPYPAGDLPKGGGYVKTAPDRVSGRWEVSAYQFSPATIVVKQGDRVTIEMIGINGAKHSVHVDKYRPDHVLVKRGEIASLSFTADSPGMFTIHCKEHEPNMQGYLVVLPR